ncbi:MAG: CxxC-x17-CxxC domain-containing protein [Candidatus Omnitrophota bacterium]
MKIFGKAKASLKSNSKETVPGLPELVMLMTKVIERLEILENKTDLVIRQMSSRSFAGRESPKTAPQPTVSSQPSRQFNLPGRPNEVKPAQGRSHEHARGRREKVLHKAVCADCQKDCEIPFKPTGERPVYCKECFSKRKAGNPVKANEGTQKAPDLPKATELSNPSERQVVVTKKGVGKVTISEIVRPSASDISQKGKSRTPKK